jgi:hypothetical protein
MPWNWPGSRAINHFHQGEFQKLTPKDGKAIVINEWLQDSDAMPYLMDRSEKDLHMADLVSKAIEMLDNPNGFLHHGRRRQGGLGLPRQ